MTPLRLIPPATALLLLLSAALASAQGFKFSNEDQADKAAAAEHQAAVDSLLATPCREKIRNQKIMVLIGENRNGTLLTKQGVYDPQFNAINSRLRGLGLRTYTAAEIKAQVAQAEIDAYFKNDPDAAISASKRLAAQYILRGLIETDLSHNAMVNVNQVAVRMNFTLTGANGRMISEATAKDESYAGRDVLGMATTLINERAQDVVAQLYSDYCRKAGIK